MNHKELIQDAFKSFTASSQLDQSAHIRFLIQSDYDIEVAKKNWQQHLKWRSIKKIDSLQEISYQLFDQIKRMYPHGFHQFDKQFRPIYIEQVRPATIYQILKQFKQEFIVDQYIFLWEYFLNTICPVMSQQSQKLINQAVIILEVKDITQKDLKKMAKLIQNICLVFNKHYPHTLHSLYIINASEDFFQGWQKLKSTLDTETQQKIFFLGVDYAQELNQLIDRQNLPLIFEGSSNYDIQSNFGPWNPNGQDIYQKNQEKKNDKQLTIKNSNNIRQKLSINNSIYQSFQEDNTIQKKITILQTPLIGKQKNIQQRITFNNLENFNLLNTDTAIFSNKIYALDLYRDYHINSCDNQIDQQSLIKLFNQDLLYLDKKNINTFAKKLTIPVIYYQLPKERYFLFFIFILLQMLQIYLEYWVFVSVSELSAFFSCTKQKIIFGFLLYIISGTFTNLFIKKYNENHKHIISIIMLLGAILRRFQNIELFWASHFLFGFGNALLVKIQELIVLNWFAPHERTFISSMIRFFSYIFMIINWSILKNQDINKSLYNQQILVILFWSTFWITFKAKPREYISYQSSLYDKLQYDRIILNYHTYYFMLIILAKSIQKSYIIAYLITKRNNNYLIILMALPLIRDELFGNIQKYESMATLNFLFGFILNILAYAFENNQIFSIFALGLFLVIPQLVQIASINQGQMEKYKMQSCITLYSNSLSLFFLIFLSYIPEYTSLFFACIFLLCMMISLLIEPECNQKQYKQDQQYQNLQKINQKSIMNGYLITL